MASNNPLSIIGITIEELFKINEPTNKAFRKYQQLYSDDSNITLESICFGFGMRKNKKLFKKLFYFSNNKSKHLYILTDYSLYDRWKPFKHYNCI